MGGASQCFLDLPGVAETVAGEEEEGLVEVDFAEEGVLPAEVAQGKGCGFGEGEGGGADGAKTVDGLRRGPGAGGAGARGRGSLFPPIDGSLTNELVAGSEAGEAVMGRMPGRVGLDELDGHFFHQDDMFGAFGGRPGAGRWMSVPALLGGAVEEGEQVVPRFCQLSYGAAAFIGCHGLCLQTVRWGTGIRE